MALRGRLARKPYWIGVGFLLGMQGLAAAAQVEGGGWAVLLGLDDILIAALISRRMRDIGRAPIWGWLGMAVAEFTAPVASALAASGPDGAIASLLAAPPTNGAVTFVLLGLLIGAAGLVRGDPGANRYGPATVDALPASPRDVDVDDDEASPADAVIARSLATFRSAADPRPPIAVPARAAPRAAAPVFGKRR